MNLDAVLSPIGFETFVDQYWEQKYLHIVHRDKDYFKQILNEINLERTLWASCKIWGDVSLAKSQTDYAVCPHTRSAPNIENLRAAFDDGYTIIINDLQKKEPVIRDLCRALEHQLKNNCNVNLYLSNRDAQGLDPHYDDEDVLILQLEGAKRWIVYSDGEPLPMSRLGYNTPSVENKLYEEILLQAGDVLYLPRGFVHAARTEGTTSLHLTVSITTTRWLDYLHELLDVAAQESLALRKSIPIFTLARGDACSAKKVISDIAPFLSEESKLNQSFSNCQRQILSKSTRISRKTFLKTQAILRNLNENSVLNHGNDQIYFHAIDDSNKGILRFIGGEISYSFGMEEVIDHIFSNDQFSLLDLYKLSEDEVKIREFVALLIEVGILNYVGHDE